ncbi:MAG TPA: DUF177 domain-containing protein [Bacteroidia bacterium]|nr:DUF177 domain-containing protein [Bacteroidia bacterium]
MRKEQLVIPFSGLAQGEHHFNFEIGNKFFEQIDNSLIKKGNAIVDVQLIKMSVMLQLHMSFTGNAQIECDRCLGEVFVPLSGKDELIVKLGGEEITDSSNIITIGAKDAEVNITLYVYEMIALNLPFRKIPCEILNNKSVCDQEMLVKLEQLKTDDQPPQNNETNPVWDSLNKLKNLN